MCLIKYADTVFGYSIFTCFTDFLKVTYLYTDIVIFQTETKTNRKRFNSFNRVFSICQCVLVALQQTCNSPLLMVSQGRPVLKSFAWYYNLSGVTSAAPIFLSDVFIIPAVLFWNYVGIFKFLSSSLYTFFFIYTIGVYKRSYVIYHQFVGLT